MSEEPVVLVLPASPHEASRLAVDREARSIEESLFRSSRGRVARVRVVLAPQLIDLQCALTKERPVVVHFCCHGSSTGITLYDQEYRARQVRGEVLAKLFALCSTYIQCVVLNACRSAEQAAAIAKHIPFVIGIDGPVNDRAAVEIATAFYRTLKSGSTIELAFQQALIAAEAAESVGKPVLYTHSQAVLNRPLFPVPERKTGAARERPELLARWRQISGEAASVGRRTLAAILALATLGAWFQLRLEEAPPGKVAVIKLTDESAKVEGLEGINDYPISLAALARLVDAVAKHEPSVIGLDISLAQGEGADALAESLKRAKPRIVLASSANERPLPVLRDVCRARADRNRCEEASFEIISGPFTLGSRLSSGSEPFLVALDTGLRPPPYAGQAILPLNAASRVNEALVPVRAEDLMGGYGDKAIEDHLVVMIGGTFESTELAPRKVDRHFLFRPWGRMYSGAELHALLTAYALGRTDQGERRRGLLWVVDYRYPLVLLIPALVAGWHRPSIYVWFPSLYVFGALAVGLGSPVVLPLWPAWVTIVLGVLRGKRS